MHLLDFPTALIWWLAQGPLCSSSQVVRHGVSNLTLNMIFNSLARKSCIQQNQFKMELATPYVENNGQSAELSQRESFPEEMACRQAQLGLGSSWPWLLLCPPGPPPPHGPRHPYSKWISMEIGVTMDPVQCTTGALSLTGQPIPGCTCCRGLHN